MRRALALMPLALLGTLSAHQLAYAWAAPGQEERAELLHSTGHQWTAHAGSLWLIAGAAIVAAAWHFAGKGARAPRPWETLLLQVLAYAAVESGERIAAGQSPWPGWELLAAGALAQVPSALAAWGLLALVLVPMLAALQGTVGVSAAPWLSQPAAWHLAWMAGSAAPSSLKARAPPR